MLTEKESRIQTKKKAIEDARNELDAVIGGRDKDSQQQLQQKIKSLESLVADQKLSENSSNDVIRLRNEVDTLNEKLRGYKQQENELKKQLLNINEKANQGCKTDPEVVNDQYNMNKNEGLTAEHANDEAESKRLMSVVDEKNSEVLV